MDFIFLIKSTIRTLHKQKLDNDCVYVYQPIIIGNDNESMRFGTWASNVCAILASVSFFQTQIQTDVNNW